MWAAASCHEFQKVKSVTGRCGDIDAIHLPLPQLGKPDNFDRRAAPFRVGNSEVLDFVFDAEKLAKNSNGGDLPVNVPPHRDV